MGLKRYLRWHDVVYRYSDDWIDSDHYFSTDRFVVARVFVSDPLTIKLMFNGLVGSANDGLYKYDVDTAFYLAM